MKRNGVAVGNVAVATTGERLFLGQLLAPKYLERYLPWHTAKFWDWLSPGLVYGIMLTAFFLGACIFTVSAIIGITL